MYNSYYGSYNTNTFADIFPSLEAFSEQYDKCAIPNTIPLESTDGFDLTTIYYLLYAQYGNSHISYSDQNQFIYKLFSIIYQYGPVWQRKMQIQANIRALEEQQLIQGSKAIYNHANNPRQAPTTKTLEELTFIDNQNTTNYKKSVLEGYSDLLMLLEEDVTESFIRRFRELFIAITAPDYPLLYITEREV